MNKRQQQTIFDFITLGDAFKSLQEFQKLSSKSPELGKIEESCFYAGASAMLRILGTALETDDIQIVKDRVEPAKIAVILKLTDKDPTNSSSAN